MWKIIVSLLFLAAIIASIGPIMSRVELPSYQVEQQFGAIEIRLYKPLLVAEVEVEGERREAIRKGFSILADYIFGNNSKADTVAMTAPVLQKANEKIPMTAPVTQVQEADAWKICFHMPAAYSLDTLPRPNDARVIIVEVPAKRAVVITFSGSSSEENIARHRKILLDFVQTHNVKTVGEPILAFYNPPWTLPFLRRNEIMLLQGEE